MGWRYPMVMAPSMSSGVATPCSTMRMASIPRHTPSREDAKPGKFSYGDHVFSDGQPKAWISWSTLSEVCSWTTTSKSFMMCTGLKKCMPMTFSGLRMAAAIFVTLKEEVFVPKTQCSGAWFSKEENRLCLSSNRSGIASMRRSASSAT